MKKAKLTLSNGREFEGWSFGHDGSVSGEVVFSTAMVGYPESLTDPSYSGQILCVSYPLVGNYGIQSDSRDRWGISNVFESDRIWVKGLVISGYSDKYSHYSAVKSLGEWLEEGGVPGICGIDTRELTKILRTEGSMTGFIVPEGCMLPELYNPDSENQVAIVSCKSPIKYGEGSKRVVLVDCGVKHRILSCLVSRGVEVLRVPWDYDFNSLEWDGLFISNGPGDPSYCTVTIDNIRRAMERGKPVFGICMGNQLLGKAAGARTYKLKYGHRSHNQPVRLEGTDRCYITSQNHGYAVDVNTLGPGWEPYFTNLNDGTNEGLRHVSLPFFSTQFHPEASSGPVDTEFLFDKFISML